MRQSSVDGSISQLMFRVGEENSQTVADPADGQGTGVTVAAVVVVVEVETAVDVVAAVPEVLVLVEPAVVVVLDDDELPQAARARTVSPRAMTTIAVGRSRPRAAPLRFHPPISVPRSSGTVADFKSPLPRARCAGPTLAAAEPAPGPGRLDPGRIPSQ